MFEIESFDDSNNLIPEFEGFAEKLERFIAVDQHFVRGSLVIALNAPFGFGKSTFLKMWSDRLRRKLDDSNGDQNPPMPVCLNAWENDYCGDPLIAILSAMIESFEKHNKPSIAEGLTEAAKDFGWFFGSLLEQIVSKVTSPSKAGEVAANKKKERQSDRQLIPENLFEEFRRKQDALEAVKTLLANIVSSDQDGTELIVLVDELDRCRPDYTISYLETINHLFNIEGITFVLAVDPKQLECSAKAAFGTDLDYPEYLRKFVHRNIRFPRISDERYRKISKAYVTEYLRKEEYISFANWSESRIIQLTEIIPAVTPTMRQTQEIFRIVRHALSTDKVEKQGKMNWFTSVITILMAALKVSGKEINDKSLYFGFGTGTITLEEAGAFCRSIYPGTGNSTAATWWFTQCLKAGGIDYGERKLPEKLTECYQVAGIEMLESPVGNYFNTRSQALQMGFGAAYLTIEEATRFVDDP